MMLPHEVTGVLVFAIWVTTLLGWTLGLHWEATHQTDARRGEIEVERAERAAQGPAPLWHRAWAVAAPAICVIVPGLLVVDALVVPIEPLRASWLTYAGPFAIWLQLLGVTIALAGVVILLWLGRVLAVRVYRRAAHERELLTTGIYTYIRHPFYLHFFLLPIGLALLTLNAAMLIVLMAYVTYEGPFLPTKWMRDEEAEMLERHGDTYAAYMARTGRLLPRLRRVR
jgi:protein-S-isoprenylcysteine O-methyltransferase Ste14